jgi:hypothetical protein
MRNSGCLWLTLALVLCAARASADEESVAQAFERMGPSSSAMTPGRTAR